MLVEGSHHDRDVADLLDYGGDSENAQVDGARSGFRRRQKTATGRERSIAQERELSTTPATPISKTLVAPISAYGSSIRQCGTISEL